MDHGKQSEAIEEKTEKEVILEMEKTVYPCKYHPSQKKEKGKGITLDFDVDQIKRCIVLLLNQHYPVKRISELLSIEEQAVLVIKNQEEARRKKKRATISRFIKTREVQE